MAASFKAKVATIIVESFRYYQYFFLISKLFEKLLKFDSLKLMLSSHHFRPLCRRSIAIKYSVKVVQIPLVWRTPRWMLTGNEKLLFLEKLKGDGLPRTTIPISKGLLSTVTWRFPTGRLLSCRWMMEYKCWNLLEMNALYFPVRFCPRDCCQQCSSAPLTLSILPFIGSLRATKRSC